MSAYDVAVLLTALLVAAGLLVGGRKASHAIRRAIRRYRLRADLAQMSDWRARVLEDTRRRTASAALPPLPEADWRRAVRDPVIGVDQAVAERRARFLVSLADADRYVDDLRIERK